MAEQLTVNFNVYGAPRGCISSVVRYGNVLYSRGSVLNIWEQQAAADEPMTMTEPGMTRFVITMRRPSI
jgi:FlaA1/EpsC-like NDP-sugar epimerase